MESRYGKQIVKDVLQLLSEKMRVDRESQDIVDYLLVVIGIEEIPFTGLHRWPKILSGRTGSEVFLFAPSVKIPETLGSSPAALVRNVLELCKMDDRDQQKVHVFFVIISLSALAAACDHRHLYHVHIK